MGKRIDGPLIGGTPYFRNQPSQNLPFGRDCNLLYFGELRRA